jgi:hypothetical protein
MEKTCATLLEVALERGGEDNITLILAEVSGDGVPMLSDAERVFSATLAEFVTTRGNGRRELPHL